MTIKEESDLLITCTMGKKSHMNLFGKIVLSPIFVIVYVTYMSCVVLFQKREESK